jgi:hypothetical protein
MRSALYYPHTHIASIGLIKTALLLWDRLEYIVPSPSFHTHYPDRHVAEAMELIGRPHCPTRNEKQKAHRRLTDLVSGQLPAQFYLNGTRDRLDGDRQGYEIYPEKLIPESWEILQKAKMAGALRDNSDYPLTKYAGLAVMSILADCCAGTTRSRITDRGDAYATVLSLLGNNSDGPKIRKADAYNQLVPISLHVVDAAKINMSALMSLRVREEKESGHTLRDLRHSYINGLESYLKQLADTEATEADAEEIRRQFSVDMKRDLKDLKAELGYARTEALTSREFIVTVLTGVATSASWLNGLNIPLEGVVTWGGAPVAIGGLVKLRSKYLKDREAAMKKHPMAYLYSAKQAGIIKRTAKPGK